MSFSSRQLEHAGDTLRIVQLTDTHLCREPGGKLLGLDTDFSLQHVIELVKQEQPELDLVLATGDIADNGSAEAYRRAQDYFAQLPAETFWLAGNHDRADTMAQELGKDSQLVRVIRAGKWQIIMLNSQTPGEVGGTLGEAEISWLRQCLEQGEQAGHFSLVCLHHQPLPIGSNWIDQQQVSDAEVFWSTIAPYAGLKGVLWGHVHQQLDRLHNGVLLMATPSTCIQFAPERADFKVDDQAPGYRWLELGGDGSITTDVHRVKGVHFSVDLDSLGYEDH